MSDVITSGARIVWGITCDDSDVVADPEAATRVADIIEERDA